MLSRKTTLLAQKEERNAFLFNTYTLDKILRHRRTKSLPEAGI